MRRNERAQSIERGRTSAGAGAGVGVDAFDGTGGVHADADVMSLSESLPFMNIAAEL
jgi:hypothetical protein